MDFIRAAIKTCFYEYPLASVAKMLIDGQYDVYCSRIVDITKWSEPAFTLSEQRLLNTIIHDKWMAKSLGGKMAGCEMARVFLMLNHFSDEVLNDADEPTVVFDNLLRWHDISHYVGENLLTCAFLAEKDSMSGYTRNNFTWSDILSHDNSELNRILGKGLADVHAHLYASTDVFAENWVALMNHVAFSKVEKGSTAATVVDIERPHQEGDANYWDDQNTLTLHQWGIVAAAIRVQLAAWLYEGEPFNRQRIVKMIGDAGQCVSQVAAIIGDISSMADGAAKLSDDKLLDYAIRVKGLNGQKGKDSPYMLHYGERRLLYNYFRRYYDMDNEAALIAPFVYLYVLIKAKYRREFVQINPLNGFENFKNYQDEKSLYAKYHASIAYKYAVQTALGKEGKNSLEARVVSSAVMGVRKADYAHSLFGKEKYFEKDVSDNLKMVVHFIKSKEFLDTDKSHRHAKLRKQLHKQMGEVILNAKRNDYAKEQNAPLLVGIDAAGAELYARPEVFAPYFRWARVKGLSNMTFHAGEDFYDLIDGLRTIDETMLFMEYIRGCRIGHGLALGVQPRRYYANRHYKAIMPKQYMLDNCVWLLNRSKMYGIELNEATARFLDDTIHALLSEIGYGEKTDLFFYWQSMMLRGDARESDGVKPFPAFSAAALCKDDRAIQARNYAEARDLHERYETDMHIRKKGAEPDEFKYPRSICSDVYLMQEAMIKEIEEKGICIESNPSSNLKIGPFDRYEDLPLLRLNGVKEPREHRVSVSINTDDRGVFSTSIHNEYSLMAIALTKACDEAGNRKYSNEEIEQYVERIMQYGQNQRFGEPVMREY